VFVWQQWKKINRLYCHVLRKFNLCRASYICRTQMSQNIERAGTCWLPVVSDCTVYPTKLLLTVSDVFHEKFLVGLFDCIFKVLIHTE